MKFASRLEQELIALRKQARQAPMINPQLTLAERLSKELDQGGISLDEIEENIREYTRRALSLRGAEARKMLGISGQSKPEDVLHRVTKAYVDAGHTSQSNRYHIVFTAHPIFGFSHQDSQLFAQNIIDQKTALPQIKPLQSISLSEEHSRAMTALDHGRTALLKLDRALLIEAAATVNNASDTPQPINMACWVGYDLDGRDDIRWIDSFCFRLSEKLRILRYYAERAQLIDAQELAQKILEECAQTEADLSRFRAYQLGEGTLSRAANALSARQDKVVDIAPWVKELQQLAGQSSDPDKGREYILLAREMQRYSLGIGEIHLRLNALQVRNAMRVVDGRRVSEGRGGESSRQLIERLNMRISALEPDEVNFDDLDKERATAVRLMMLARQIFKHVDAEQPIRLLVAECERPLTLLSTLYLAKQFQVAEHIDISPLFETRLGLERGSEIMDQLVRNPHFADYVRGRKRLCIQTGFSDAGRFIGQLPAVLAIERLQVKLSEVHASEFSAQDVSLLIFNTHGESLGRGGARGSFRNRQEYIFSPYARKYASKRNIAVIHESAFQGGDGYLWFDNAEIAEYTVARLFESEFLRETETEDPLYTYSDFALDVFLGIKNWQDELFRNPDYGGLLGLFDNNMLPKTGSRPSKRASSSIGMRQDPSKIRAIVHNALLQQAGYLANVVGGLGHASMIDLDRFKELYQRSPRLRLLVDHALRAQKLGSTAAISAHGTLFLRGFWINRAYQSSAPWHLRSCRSIADALSNDSRSEAVIRLTSIFRDDLLDLRNLQRALGLEDVEEYPDGRLLMDSLQVVRLVLIMEIMFLITRVPRFAEHNETGRTDLIRMALSLDITTVTKIIENEFLLVRRACADEKFSEKGMESDQAQRYQEIETQILVPMSRMSGLIKHISMVIGCLYAAHG